MPRKSSNTTVNCIYFEWKLFCRVGVYYADGRGGRYKLGKHSLGTRDREEALERLKALDLHCATKLGLAQTEAVSLEGEINISDGWQIFIDYCGRSPVLGGVSPKTVKRYSAVRDKHMKFCSEHGITDWNHFNKATLERYANWLTKKAAYRTVYFELTLIKSVITWLIENKRLPADAKLVYPLTKPEGTDTYCYTRKEVAAMIRHCDADPKRRWLSAVIIALAHLGVRIGELATLRWSDVDLENNIVTVADERASKRKRAAGTARTTKGKRSRRIPIHPRLRALLAGLVRGGDGFVFHAPQGGRLRENNVLHVFIRDVIKPLKSKFPTPEGEIGFEHGRLHSFRHFFVSQCFLGGASEGEIREWVGHRDSKMVEHYRHLGREDAQRRMDQITFVTLGADEQAQPGGKEYPAQTP